MQSFSSPAHTPIRKRQDGLTLVETIVAILLIASITIGIAAIYAARQNIARGGRLHAHAVELAQQMAASIRNSSDGTTNFETTLGATCTKQADKATVSNKKKSNAGSNLVACWRETVEQELTDGSANISLDRSSVPPQYVIVVSWSEPRSGTASYVLRATAAASKADPAASIPVGATHAAD